jgi:hypothetical protein
MLSIIKDGKANPPANFIVEHRDVPHCHIRIGPNARPLQNNTPFCNAYILLKVHIYVGGGLYQRIYYTLPEMALQGFAATLIYALITPSNNRCKFATDIIGYGNTYMCLYKSWTKDCYSS